MFKLLYFFGLIKNLAWVKFENKAKLLFFKADAWNVKTAQDSYRTYVLKEDGTASQSTYRNATGEWKLYEGPTLKSWLEDRK